MFGESDIEQQASRVEDPDDQMTEEEYKRMVRDIDPNVVAENKLTAAGELMDRYEKEIGTGNPKAEGESHGFKSVIGDISGFSGIEEEEFSTEGLPEGYSDENRKMEIFIDRLTDIKNRIIKLRTKFIKEGYDNENYGSENISDLKNSAEEMKEEFEEVLVEIGKLDENHSINLLISEIKNDISFFDETILRKSQE